jgi:hypothetical protein
MTTVNIHRYMRCRSKIKHFDNQSFRELILDSECLFVQNKMLPFANSRYLYRYCPLSFRKQTNFFNLSSSLDWRIVGQSVDKSNVLVLVYGERDLDCI